MFSHKCKHCRKCKERKECRNYDNNAVDWCGQ